VHAVYARYRKPLLRQGVELYELRPIEDGSAVGDVDPARLTLHSKVAIVDRRSAFVGSFNLDPRSLYINTELGMVVESGEVAEAMASSGLESLRTVAYRVLWACCRSKSRCSYSSSLSMHSGSSAA
jgi:putative cardiolipin synthase